MNYVFRKIDLIDGVIVRSLHGYVDSVEDKNTIITNHCSDYCNWLESNVVDLDAETKTISDYPNYPAYQFAWETTSNGDLGLTLLTDFVNLS